MVHSRVLARISKMPVQNSNFKISARPDLATNLLQILIPAIFDSLVCQKGQFTLQLCPRRWFARKTLGHYTQKFKIQKIFIEIFACPNGRFLGNYLSKRQAGQVLAKSLVHSPPTFKTHPSGHPISLWLISKKCQFKADDWSLSPQFNTSTLNKAHYALFQFVNLYLWLIIISL